MDPNRPFKCEICRESFTQKNILLVHYNSVSHLHKLKKQSENNNTPSTSPSHQNDYTKNSENDKAADCDNKSFDNDSDRRSYDLDIEIESNKRKLSTDSNDYDNSRKRFKCDVCKVAYAQGSTLDIHMRSVLHQTRACRLQEQQFSANLLRMQERSQPLLNIHDSSMPSNLNTSFDASMLDVRDTSSPKLNNQIYKTLLENFGFDIVKQFNEINKNTTGEINKETIVTPPIVSESHVPKDNYFCRHCKKQFSSIFVLKTHCEEFHNEKIPLEILEKFADKFKNYLESSNDNESEVLDFSSKKPLDNTIRRSSTPSPRILTPVSPTTSNSPSISMLPDIKPNLTKSDSPGCSSSFPNVLNSGNALAQNIPMNTLDMLNIMQFHHLISLNFMNLAPPLIFGGATTPPNATASPSSTELQSPAQQQAQILQHQAAAAQVIKL